MLRISPAVALISVALISVGSMAHAGGSSLKTYDFDQGLTSLGGGCLMQDLAGYLIVCTEHGPFTYDGRRFVNLGPAQGLREGGDVTDLVMTARGRIAAGYADGVYVSDRATGALTSPEDLYFQPAPLPPHGYEDTTHRMVAWRDGLAVLNDGRLSRVTTEPDGPPQAGAIDYTKAERTLLAHPTALFAIRGALWTTSDDARICRAEPGSVECYGTASGLPNTPWFQLVAGPDRTILARSADAVATFDPLTHRWTVAKLPDQGGRYLNYVAKVGIFRAPDGSFVTQAEHGLDVLRPDGWHGLTVADGVPPGVITDAMTDRTGQFWFHILGVGLVRWIGFGQWDSIRKSDGLSEGELWAAIRATTTSIWAASDTAIDTIDVAGPGNHVTGVIPGGSYAMTRAADGRIWSGLGNHAIRAIDPLSHKTWDFETAAVDALAADASNTIWAGTEKGLLEFSGAGPPRLIPSPKNALASPVLGVAQDGQGGVFYLSGARVRHRHADGSDAEVVGALPASGVDPFALARQADGILWVAGAGGAFRIRCSGDRVVSVLPIGTVDTQSNTIFAVMVDHRGWVWMGTSLGVSVYNGQRWLTIDADRGLLSNEVNANGLYEDKDGSVWITTVQGLSHLRNPDAMFASEPVRALISETQIAGAHVTGARMPFSHHALTLQFGTPDFGAEGSILFRYRLSGVDADWVETATGNVRYPFVPPGRHELTLVAYDTLTHVASEPVRLLVDMAFPWWRRWWSEILFVLLAFALVYMIVRLRLRVALARQAELKRLVAEATEEIRLAETELRYRAAHDSLTGLLNRAEIERRLPARLAGQGTEESILVALLDIDHFKRVNDERGHIGGDNVLRALGRLVARTTRVGEDAGRYGGEEILLVLDDGDRTAAARIAELHRAVRDEPFGARDAEWHVTCSIGLAWARAGDDWESLVGRADDALYDAKDAGRDRIVESRRTPRFAPGPELQAELDRLAAIAQHPVPGLVPDGLVRS